MRRDELWIFAVALLVRLVHLSQALGSPLSEVLVVDADHYEQQALAILSGRSEDRVFFMAPLYPYLLATIYRLLGHSWLAVVTLQSVGGALTALLTYKVGRRLFDRDVARIAGAIVALHGVLVFYDASFLTASVSVLLDTAALWLLLRAFPGTPGSSLRSRALGLLAAGVLLGISALARANVLLFVLLVLAGMRLCERSWRPVVPAWMLVVAGVALAIVPVTLRNVAVGGEWVLTSANAGMNFYAGNHADAAGSYAQPAFLESAEPRLEGEAYRAEAARRLGHDVSWSQASRFWLLEALHELAADPARAARLAGQKLQVFFNRVEAQTNPGYYVARDFS